MPRTILFSACFKDFYPFDKFLQADRCYVADHKAVLNLAKHSPEKSLLIFWGGQDIHPSFYGEKHCSMSGAFPKPSQRDVLEAELYYKAVEIGLPVLGICRGSQLMCALNGGKLVQHVTHHTSDHSVTTNTGEEFFVTSTHHQMMLPKGDFELIGWSSKKRSSVYLGAGVTPIEECQQEAFREPEIVFYPKTRTLAVQGHPEYCAMGEDFPQFVFRLLKEKLNVGS